MLLHDVEVEGARVDVRIEGSTIAAIEPHLAPRPGEEAVAGGGGALIPGLHDHHLHLLAIAAADHSVAVGPRETTGLDGLASTLRAAPGTSWLRATGYVEEVAGDLDRARLDLIEPTRPVRIQHRSGALWMLNSAAIDVLGLDNIRMDGLERDADDRLTGRLWRMDGWIASRLTELNGADFPDLTNVGLRLAKLGITGVTDATPDLDDVAVDHLIEARRSGALPQQLQLLGTLRLDPEFLRGPIKIVVGDHDLPEFPALLNRITLQRALGRAVAVHCVTRAALALTIAVLTETGTLPGDRVEHASLADLSAVAEIQRLGISVVTQPGFIPDRGDDYLRDLPPSDHNDLYRFASFLACGVDVVASSDAPYGPLDPWLVMRAAAHRESRSSVVINPSEQVSASLALAGMLRPLENLHAAPRRLQVGTAADVVLLNSPLSAALREPEVSVVRQTWIDGLPRIEP